MLKVAQHINSVFNSITYIIHNESDCWLVDVGDYADIKDQFLGLYSLKGVFLTHTHFDHIYGLNELIKDFPSMPVYTNTFGKEALINPSVNLSKYHETPFELKSIENVFCVAEGDIITILDRNEVRVLETPGHDPSCLSFIIGDFLFTGDSYIPGRKVFTKFQCCEKTRAVMTESKLSTMQGNFSICPGHII